MTDNDFINAVNWLISQGQLSVTTSRFIDAANRKVYDETVPIADITPSAETLEIALFAANSEIEQKEIDTLEDNNNRAVLINQYNAALSQISGDSQDITIGRTALASVATLTQLKPIIDGMLVIINRQLNREEKTLKAIRALIRMQQ